MQCTWAFSVAVTHIVDDVLLDNKGEIPMESIEDVGSHDEISLFEALQGKLDEGVITLSELASFIQRKRTIIGRNEHGHIVFTVNGLDLTGEQEIERLEASGYRVNESAKSCFLSKNADSYDRDHHLDVGREYKVALVMNPKIDQLNARKSIREIGFEYCYSKPLAGIVPRIREAISSGQLIPKNHRQYNIIVPHVPIADSKGKPRTLVVASGYAVGDCVIADSYWGSSQYLAFTVPNTEC